MNQDVVKDVEPLQMQDDRDDDWDELFGKIIEERDRNHH